MAKRIRPLRFLVTGALLVGPMACGDTPIEDLPTHNEAPLPDPPETQQPETQQPEAQPPESEAVALEQAQDEAPVDNPMRTGVTEALGLSTNAVPPHLQPPSPLHSMDPEAQK